MMMFKIISKKRYEELIYERSNYKERAAVLEEAAKAANKRSKELKTKIHVYVSEIKQLRDLTKMIKAEAISEMNARLYAYKTDIYIRGEELMIIPLSDYDIIMKELTEEQKQCLRL